MDDDVASIIRQARCPASCWGPPSATTEPANRLNCTVKRIQNPGPCSGACLASNRCARKNRSGSSWMSVNRSVPLRTWEVEGEGEGGGLKCCSAASYIRVTVL